MGLRPGVLGPAARALAEDLVARPEVGDLGAYGFHYSGQVEAGDAVAGTAQAEAEAGDVWEAGHRVPGAAVDAGGVDAYQNLLGFDRGFRHVGQVQDVGVAVDVADYGPHDGSSVGY
jgi:hypothetical protein